MLCVGFGLVYVPCSVVLVCCILVVCVLFGLVGVLLIDVVWVVCVFVVQWLVLYLFFGRVCLDLLFQRGLVLLVLLMMFRWMFVLLFRLFCVWFVFVELGAFACWVGCLDCLFGRVGLVWWLYVRLGVLDLVQAGDLDWLCVWVELLF